MISKKKLHEIELIFDRPSDQVCVDEIANGRMTLKTARVITGKKFRWAGSGSPPPDDKFIIVEYSTLCIWEWKLCEEQ